MVQIVNRIPETSGRCDASHRSIHRIALGNMIGNHLRNAQARHVCLYAWTWSGSWRTKKVPVFSAFSNDESMILLVTVVWNPNAKNQKENSACICMSASLVVECDPSWHVIRVFCGIKLDCLYHRIPVNMILNKRQWSLWLPLQPRNESIPVVYFWIRHRDPLVITAATKTYLQPWNNKISNVELSTDRDGIYFYIYWGLIRLFLKEVRNRSGRSIVIHNLSF